MVSNDNENNDDPVDKTYDDQDLQKQIDKYNSLKYSEILISNHLERALSKLDAFADCDAKQLLKHVVHVVQNRHS